MIEMMPVKFGAVVQSADPKALPPGTMVKAENCIMDKPRRLRKRPGTDALPDGNIYVQVFPLEAGVRLQSRGNDIVVHDGMHVHHRTNNAYRAIGKTTPFKNTRRGLADSSRSAAAVDICLLGDRLIRVVMSGYSVTNGSMLFLEVENVHTGAKEFPPIFVGYGQYARVHVIPEAGPNGYGTILVTFGENASGRVLCWMYTLDYGYRGTFVLNVSPNDGQQNASGGLPFDSCYQVTSGGLKRLYVAYGLNSPVGSYYLRVHAFQIDAYNATMANVGGFYAPAYAGVHTVAIACDPLLGGAVTWSDASSSCKIYTFNTNGASTGVGTDVPASTWCQNVFLRFWTHLDTGVRGLIVGRVRSSVAQTLHQSLQTSFIAWATCVEDPNSSRITYHAQGVTRPWVHGDRMFVACTLFPRELSLLSTATLTAASTVVLEIDGTRFPELGWGQQEIDSSAGHPHSHVGTLENQTGWTPHNKYYSPGIAEHADGQIYVPAAYRNLEPTNIQRLPVGWNLHRLDPIELGDTHRMVAVGEGGLAAGAAPYWFDGLHAYAYGFVHAPMILSYIAGSSTVGGAMVPGTYQYIAVYEWRDASGMLHRSPPSPSKTVVVVAGTSTNRVGLELVSSSLSRKSPVGLEEGPVHVVLYRTTVGGSTFYRLTFEPQYGMTENVSTAGSMNFIDTKGDADIAGQSPARPLSVQPQLYTMTGELPDVAPPSFQTVTVHRGRYVGIDASGLTAWLSKDQSEDPTIAAGFNEALTYSFVRPRIAVTSLDEKCIFFGTDDIDVMFGQGPDATGNGEWQVQRLQTDVGCVNPRSVVTLPMGVMFESRRGLELLTRELTVAWKGSDIQDDLAAFPTITSAVLVASAHEVRFTCVSADGLTGIVLAWDYLHEVWFRRVYKNAAGVASLPFVDASIIAGVYSMLDASGVVYQESATHFRDCNGQWVTRDIQLAPMSPSGSALAWHRVKDVTLLLTSAGGDHLLEVSAAHDFSSTWDQVETFPVGSLTVFPADSNKGRMTFAKQKCQAVALRIRDLPWDITGGEGPIIEGLALRVDTKRGPVRTAASEQK